MCDLFFLFFSLIGLSSYCAELNYVRPELTDSDELDIRGGRYDVDYRDFFNSCLLVSRLLFKISISETWPIAEVHGLSYQHW